MGRIPGFGTVPNSNGFRMRRNEPSARGRSLQHTNIELLHLQKCLGYPFDALLVVTVQEFPQDGGSDLPGQPVLILEPATLFRLRVRRELRPEIIDLLLRVARHYDRYRFAECEFVLVRRIHGTELLA